MIKESAAEGKVEDDMEKIGRYATCHMPHATCCRLDTSYVACYARMSAIWHFVLSIIGVTMPNMGS